MFSQLWELDLEPEISPIVCLSARVQCASETGRYRSSRCADEILQLQQQHIPYACIRANFESYLFRILTVYQY
jgi:hypothetical protein